MKNTTNKYKVAVYGSLRKGLHNHSRYLGNQKLLGTFESKPEYTMYAVSSAFPGVIRKGYNSITMEVYEVNSEALSNIDLLEGYIAKDNHQNHYNKEQIDTPYGKAFTYMYNDTVNDTKIVESGDWHEFYKVSSKVNNINS